MRLATTLKVPTLNSNMMKLRYSTSDGQQMAWRAWCRCWTIGNRPSSRPRGRRWACSTGIRHGCTWAISENARHRLYRLHRWTDVFIFLYADYDGLTEPDIRPNYNAPSPASHAMVNKHVKMKANYRRSQNTQIRGYGSRWRDLSSRQLKDRLSSEQPTHYDNFTATPTGQMPPW